MSPSMGTGSYMTWVLILLIALGTGRQQHGVITAIPGYRSWEDCNKAAKQAYDEVRHVDGHVNAFCVTGP